ncbi:hypothetical protein TNCV_186921 [Trichonephila clavipes]|nr:hypothetical protein TNCV_186921 [Trichonephila clavipes]
MSEISSNLFPFKVNLSRGNRKKSGGLRFGENGGCSICTTHFFVRNCLTILAVKLETFHAQENWTAAEWNQVVFSNESRFNLSSDEIRVCVWRPRGERLNPAFALQRQLMVMTNS